MSSDEDTEPDDIEVLDSWSHSVTGNLERSAKRAWIVATVAAAIAFLEAIALVWLIPLKTVEPYTLLVDRQTGNVEALAPLDAQVIEPDAALTRSFLVQYVIARESFDANSLQSDYRKVGLWSDGTAGQRYAAMMQANNPASPLAYMPRGGIIRTEIRSISSLSADSSMVRFTTTRTDPGGRPQEPQYWAAIINYAFDGAVMSEADRLINPLGFQVTSYRRDAETLPELADLQAEAASRPPERPPAPAPEATGEP